MSLADNLKILGIAIGSWVGTGIFVETLRKSNGKEEKEFVAAWDKLAEAWKTQADLKQMEIESSKLSYQQRAFKQKWGKYLTQ